MTCTNFKNRFRIKLVYLTRFDVVHVPSYICIIKLDFNGLHLNDNARASGLVSTYSTLAKFMKNLLLPTDLL